MSDVQLEDLKQFILATVSQSEVQLEQRLELRFGKRFDRLEARVDAIDSKIDGLRTDMMDGFAGVGDAIDVIHRQIDDNYQQLDRRLSRLEHQAA